MAYELQTSIDIQAAPETVWSVLTNFGDYPNWNPFVREIEGRAEVGARLSVRLVPPGGKGMTMKPKVLRADENEEFRWLGHFLIPGIFDGEHYFRLEALPDGTTRFHQGEHFRGVLVPLMKGFLNGSILKGFNELNQAMKNVCERNPS